MPQFYTITIEMFNNKYLFLATFAGHSILCTPLVDALIFGMIYLRPSVKLRTFDLTVHVRNNYCLFYIIIIIKSMHIFSLNCHTTPVISLTL